MKGQKAKRLRKRRILFLSAIPITAKWEDRSRIITAEIITGQAGMETITSAREEAGLLCSSNSTDLFPSLS